VISLARNRVISSVSWTTWGEKDMMVRNFLEGNEAQRQGHRIWSASAMFQKGIYHLFRLRKSDFSDAFDKTLRLYQCVFLICVTQMLLDFEGVQFRKLGKRDKERANNDPGAAITHSWVEKWPGFNSNHLLHEVSQETKQLYQNICDARHNLIYRPYLVARDNIWFWEDCTLEELLRARPTVNDVEQTYKDFYKSIKSGGDRQDQDSLYIRFFRNFVGMNSSNSQLTILLKYARALNPKSNLNLQLLDEIRRYRNQLLGEEIEEKFLDDELKKSVDTLINQV
jgi:hypothetical protein